MEVKNTTTLSKLLIQPQRTLVNSLVHRYRDIRVPPTAPHSGALGCGPDMDPTWTAPAEMRDVGPG